MVCHHKEKKESHVKEAQKHAKQMSKSELAKDIKADKKLMKAKSSAK